LIRRLVLSHSRVIAILLLIGLIASVGVEEYARVLDCNLSWATEMSSLQAYAVVLKPVFCLIVLYGLSFFTKFTPRVTALVSAALAAFYIWGALSSAIDWASGIECYRESDPSGEGIELLVILLIWPWCFAELSNFALSVLFFRLDADPNQASG
jgi:hypothetical protein